MQAAPFEMCVEHGKYICILFFYNLGECDIITKQWKIIHI